MLAVAFFGRRTDAMTNPPPLRELRDCRVLVTATSFGQQDPSLKEALQAAVGQVIYNPNPRPLKAGELIEMVAEFDGVIAGLDEFNADVLRAAQRLRVLARYGVGVDRVDLYEAQRRGILVTNTPGANSTAVAELTLAFILALARHLTYSDAATHRGEWPRLNGLGLRGRVVGLVGLGGIGREVSLLLKAFGCRILASDPYVTRETAARVGAELTNLEDLLHQSDFVSLHAQVTPVTRGIVDEAFLNKMKSGAFLVNTARGELIDENALRNALEKGALQGAALDCFCEEPLSAGNLLLKLPQVIATPHMGAHTDEAVNQMGRMALNDCLAVLCGETPRYRVTI
jgi:D-3-phosphoglycerate dehydrogenase